MNRSALLVEHAHLSFPTIGVHYSLPMIPTLETIPLSFICFRVMQAIPQDSCVSVMICDIEELLSFHNSVSCCDWSLFLSIIYLSSNYHLYHPSISSSYLCVYCLSIYKHTQLLTYIGYNSLGSYDYCTIIICLKITEIMYILINFVILKINTTFYISQSLQYQRYTENIISQCSQELSTHKISKSREMFLGKTKKTRFSSLRLLNVCKIHMYF